MKRDIVLGVIAGLVALEVLVYRRAQTPPVPPGIYQGALDEAKHREALRSLEPRGVASRETRKKLETKIETFEVDGRRLDWVIGYLADAAGVDIDVDWASITGDASPADPVTVKLRDVTVAAALRAVLRVNEGQPGPRILMEAARVRVTSAEQAGRDAVTRVYDVRDMIDAVVADGFQFARRARVAPDAPATAADGRPPATAPATAPAAADFVDNRSDAVDLITRFVMESVDPTSWRDAGGTTGAIRTINGRMLVTQTRANHDDIAVLLEWMRKGALK